MTTIATESAQRRPVRLLPPELVNQIAAGEVVERPSSVVKELIENAIDAGARSIEIILENGGKKLVEISDDGCGMSTEDATAAIQRHATSKISRFEDLQSVETLGFRGEALPSIASVSDFSLVTFDGRGEHAVEVSVRGGGDPEIRPAARRRGTTVRVANLFEYVPARKKFLKSSDAEFRAIVAIVTSYALPAPWRAFRLEHNGRLVLDLPPAADMRERLVQVLGDEVAANLEEIRGEIEGCSVGGYVTRGLRYGSRRNQFFFVNGRLVKDRVLTHAANRATEAFDADGHPAIVLFLSMDPMLVDVNVHPAKTEVRFRDSSRVHIVVEHGVKGALAGPESGAGLLTSAAPEQTIAPLLRAVDDAPAIRESQAPFSPSLQKRFEQNFEYGVPPAHPRTEFTPLFSGRPVVQPPREEERAVDLGDLRGKILGQYRDSYIILETPEGLRLVDQHVAHERVLYDRISSMTREDIATQRLITPFIYEAGAAERGVLESHVGELREIGFEIEPMSGRSFAVAAVPTLLKQDSLEKFFRKVIDAAADDRTPHLTKVRDKLIATIACHAAIKIHRPLTGAEMSRVVGDLLGSSNPFACPHGRPIIVDIRHIDIERHFHRK